MSLVLLLSFLGAPRSAFAGDCPSGAMRERGKCVCPTGKKLSLDGARCVQDKGKDLGFKSPKVAELKIEGKEAAGDMIPSGAKVQIIDISKDDIYFGIRASLRGKKGVVYPDQMTNSGKAKRGDYFGGNINIDGIDYYFYQVTVAILGFDGTVTTASPCCGDFIPSGSVVSVKDISSSDYYYSDRTKMARLSCTVGSDGLVPTGGAWYGGPVTCDNGSYYYFYQFTFDLISTASTSSSSCASGAYSGATLAEGQRVQIADISSSDAYYADRWTIIGKQGYVSGDLHNNGGCWYGGGFTADDGTYYYFYQAQVMDLGYAPVASCQASASYASSFSEGQRVKILDISSEDLYYPDRVSMAGMTGTVTGDLHNNGGCWFGGGFTADNGTYYYFYKAQVTSVSGGGSSSTCKSDASTASSFADGQRVKILDISPDDAYYPDKSTVIGVTGKVSGDLHNNGGCWFGGGFTADNGTYYYFYKAQVTSVSGGGAGGGSKYTGSSVAVGTYVTILDISSSDAYYSDRGAIIGKSCKVGDGPMTSTGTGWFGGQVYCTDGTSYYFYQAAVSLSSGGSPALGGKYTGTTVKRGTKFQIIDVSTEDAYYSDRTTIIGKSDCKAEEDMSSTGSGWFAGSVTCSDGSSYYFYQVAVSLKK